MHECLEPAPRTGDIGGIDRHLLGITLDGCTANWAARRRLGGRRWLPRISAIDERRDDLWDNLAGTLHLHPVADPEIFLGNEVEVVQRGQFHRRATDLHRL